MDSSEQKYVVFKASDWYGDGELPDGPFPEPLSPDSFTVIRHQDIFASSALYAYANLIQTAIEIITQTAEGDEDPDLSDLCAIRDLFFERAHQAQAAIRRIPD